MGRPSSGFGRASMMLAEPPINPHIEAALKASKKRREEDVVAALAIEPVISSTTEKLLLESMAWETGAIIPSTRAWKVDDRQNQTGLTSESVAEQLHDVKDRKATKARKDSVDNVSVSTGGEWWSTASSDFGEAPVSDTRRGSAPVGPVAWWPKTTVFKRRDSLVQLINDKSISSEERKARRLTRSREKERNEVPREAPLHVKHYGKMCLLRSDQKLSFRDTESFPVVDTYHHPLRDRSLSELREREPGLRPENMDHNATLVIRERGLSTVNPEEARRTPKHAALYHNMAALPDLPTDARPVTMPSSLEDLRTGIIDQPSLSLAYMRERTSLASRGASEHDLRQRDNLRKLDEKMESVTQQKHTVAARHSFLDVERHVRRPATEPTGTTADGRPVSSGPGYAIGSDRMPVHTGVVPQRWTVGRGKDQKLMDPSMWDEARELAERSRGSNRSAVRQTTWKQLDKPDEQQRRLSGAALGDLSAIGIDASQLATLPVSEPKQSAGLDQHATAHLPQELTKADPETKPDLVQAVDTPDPQLAVAPAPESEQKFGSEGASATPESEQAAVDHTRSNPAAEETEQIQDQLRTEPAVDSDFSVAALEAEFAESVTPRASTPGSGGQWAETREIRGSTDKRSWRDSENGPLQPSSATCPLDPLSIPHVGGVAGSCAPAAGSPAPKAAKPAERRAAKLDPRSNRAVSAAAIEARRKGVWALSKQLRGENGKGRAPSQNSSSQVSSRSSGFRRGSRWSTLVADELSSPDIGDLPLALPGSFQGDPAARWFGSNRVLRNSRSRENMTSLSTVSSLL